MAGYGGQRRNSIGAQVGSLWRQHDPDGLGFLEKAQLRSLLDELRQEELGGDPPPLSEAAFEQCCLVLKVNASTGQLRQEVFARNFKELWAGKEDFLEIRGPVATVKGSEEADRAPVESSRFGRTTISELRQEAEDAKQEKERISASLRAEVRHALGEEQQEAFAMQKFSLTLDLQEGRIATLKIQLQEEVQAAIESGKDLAIAKEKVKRVADVEAAAEVRVRTASTEARLAQEDAAAESAALLTCKAELASVERREAMRKLFDNVEVEFQRKEEQANEELRQALALRNEAAQAADEALKLRMTLTFREQDLASRRSGIDSGEEEVAAKLKLATDELDRARGLTQQLSKDKGEAAAELAEARQLSASAASQRSAAHQQSQEAHMAAREAEKAVEAANQDRLRVEQAVRKVAEELERADRLQRQSEDVSFRGEGALRLVQRLETEVAEYSNAAERLSRELKVEHAACQENRVEKERAQRELRDLSRLARLGMPRLRGAT